MTDDPIRVLMVEDQTDLREMIGLALRDFGIEVATTADGHEAAALLKGEARFDVVFSDVSMPNGMSGIELSEHVAREQPQARMILSSGYARSQLPPLPEQVEFLPKPYRLRQLVAAAQAGLKAYRPAWPCSAPGPLHEQQRRRGCSVHRLEAEGAVHRNCSGIVPIDPQGQPFNGSSLARLRDQRLHQPTPETAAPRLRRNQQAAQMDGARLRGPGLAETHALVACVQQQPPRAFAQLQYVLEPIGWQWIGHARPGPAQRGCGRIQPPGDARVVLGCTGCRRWSMAAGSRGEAPAYPSGLAGSARTWRRKQGDPGPIRAGDLIRRRGLPLYVRSTTCKIAGTGLDPPSLKHPTVAAAALPSPTPGCGRPSLGASSAATAWAALAPP
jgi:CheY-like chemotaxis protein